MLVCIFVANINVLDVLLQNGGEIDQKNNIGKTPLLCAVEKSNFFLLNEKHL